MEKNWGDTPSATLKVYQECDHNMELEDSLTL